MALKIDPEFKALIPPLSDEEYAQLKENILHDKKCRDAIILWEGTIIDGHNRFNICETHGIKFMTKDMAFASREDAKVWIIENQLGRRNLCDAARIELALVKTELLREKAKINLKRGGKPLPKTTKLHPKDVVNIQKATANEAGVSKGTVSRYTQIKENGDPELLAKVKSGELKIGTAHRMMTETVSRLKQANKMYAYIEERFPFDDDEINTKIQNGLQGLAAQLQKLIEEVKSNA
ncbi:MAG: hypothetical protein FWB80_05410 [Defluviitaleaceae bacterium]|nr:hypothetical protein [Defluviitaleaceae bacterium]